MLGMANCSQRFSRSNSSISIVASRALGQILVKFKGFSLFSHNGRRKL